MSTSPLKLKNILKQQTHINQQLFQAASTSNTIPPNSTKPPSKSKQFAPNTNSPPRPSPNHPETPTPG
jgi:hypothetical protein